MTSEAKDSFTFYQNVNAAGVMAGLGVVAFCAGCHSTTPLPPADLSAPGWHLRQGQAVWKPTEKRPELTGELLLATNVNGNYFVQLTKTPFPIVTAQVRSNVWDIEFGAGERKWQGLGNPPARFSWFELRNVLSGQSASKNWKFDHETMGRWRLENTRSGEILEGEFFP